MAGTYNITPAAGAQAGSPGVTNQSALGAGDAASKGGLYLVEDFNQAYVGPPGSAQVATFVQASNTAGMGNGGVVFPAAELAQHPGIAFVKTNSVGYAHLSAANGTIPLYSTSGVTTTWNITFRTPDSASNTTDTFQFCAGNSVAGAIGYPGTGAGLSYRDSVNGGNWQTYCVYTPNEAPVYGNTAVAFTPATWNNLTISHNGNSFSYTLNGTPLGSLTDSNLTPSFVWQVSAGTVYFQRTVASATPAVVTTLIDRCSVNMTGLTR